MLDVIPEKLAVILVDPMPPNDVARPCVPGRLLIVAIDVFEENHVTVLVMSCEKPSVNFPVAVNCCVPPKTMLAEEGVTSMEDSAAGVTVRVAPFDVIPKRVAVIVVVPWLRPVATPFDPDALLIVAVVFEESHVTAEVISNVEPSE